MTDRARPAWHETLVASGATRPARPAAERRRRIRGRASGTTVLWRRLLAELLGSAFLAAVVIGSGIAAQQLSPGDVGLQLFENAAATAAGLFAIILMFGPVSGAHFNPVVSFVDAAFGGLILAATPPPTCPSRSLGCIVGASLANLMFSEAAISISTKHRASGPHFLSEVVATLGLMLVDLRPRPQWASPTWPRPPSAPTSARPTSSPARTSFANPAITVGRMFSNTFAGIAPSSVPSFVSAQIVGGALAFGVIRVALSREGRLTQVAERRRCRIVSARWPHASLRCPKEPAMTRRPVVLFLCTHNAGRSLAARVLLDHYARGSHRCPIGRFRARRPAQPGRRGAPASNGDSTRAGSSPSPSADGVAQEADVIVTMGCGDTCPVYPGKRYVDWDLEDPAGRPVDAVRPIVDEIDWRTQDLLAELVAEAP